MSWHRNVRLLSLHNFFLDFRPYGPIAVIYFAHVTGSFALGLSIFSVASIAAALFEVPTGVLSDRVGRKWTIVLGSLASVASILLYAVSGSFWILCLGSVFGGLAEAFFSGNNDALLYDTLKQENKENEFADRSGKASSMFQLGLGVSAFIGGFLADISLAFVMWISIIPQVCCFIVSLFFEEPKKHYRTIQANIFTHLRDALSKFKTNYKLRDLSLTSILGYGIGETVHQFVPAFFATLWPTWALGIPRTLSHVFAGLGFHFAGTFIKKFTALKNLLIGTTLNRLLALFAYGIPTVMSPLIVPITSFFFGLNWTSKNSLLHEEFTDHQRATMGSLNGLFQKIFFGIFAFAFGFVADKLNPASALLIGEILLIPLPIIYWRLFRNHTRSLNKA